MLQTLILGKLAGPIIRHGATIAGGWLLASGYADAAAVEAISGGIIALGGVAMSIAEKKLRF